MKSEQPTSKGGNGNRRSFVRLVAGTVGITSIGSIGISGSAVASSQTVHGRIQKADNRPAATDRVSIGGRRLIKRVLTNRGGRFEFDPEDASRVRIGYYNTIGDTFSPTSVRDGSPDMFSLAQVEIGDDKINLGNLELPDAHLLNVKVEDQAGDPITDVRVGLYHRKAVEHGTIYFGTGRPMVNDDGEFQLPSAELPGLELVGTVRAQVWPHDYVFEDGPIAEKEFELTEDRTVTFVL